MEVLSRKGTQADQGDNLDSASVVRKYSFLVESSLALGVSVDALAPLDFFIISPKIIISKVK